MVTKLTLQNLGTVPSPGTTFTSYFVAWTGPDNVLYATETDVDASGLVFYGYGPFDGVNQLSTYNGTTGTFTAGANGTITVNVPLSGVGNPAIPITDPAGTPAVTNPFAVSIAGQGALGGGLFYNVPMDRAPDNGFGPRWAVCAAASTPTPTPTPTATPTPTPTPTGSDPCVSATTKLLDDPTGDQTGAPATN